MSTLCRSWFVACCALWLSYLGSGCAAHRAQTADLSAAQQTELRQKELLEHGIEFSRSGDWERAEEYLSAALDAGASADLVLPTLLHSCIAARRYRTAAEHAEDQLPELRRKLPEVELILAALYLNLDEPNRALQLLRRVVLAQPSNATAHFLLAQTLSERFQEPAQADPHFRTYLELEPNGHYSELARNGLLTFVMPQAIEAPSAAPVRAEPETSTP